MSIHDKESNSLFIQGTNSRAILATVPARRICIKESKVLFLLPVRANKPLPEDERANKTFHKINPEEVE